MAERLIDLPNGTKVKIRTPTITETQKAEWEYSKTWNKAISAGIPPKTVILESLRENGLWTEADEEKSDQFQEDTALLYIQLQAAGESGNETEFADVKNKLAAKRNEHLIHLNRLNEYLQHTAEEKADEAKKMHLVFLCTETEDGKKFWKTIKEFEAEDRNDISSTIIYNFLFLLNGLDPDLASNLPENKVELKEIKETDE